MTTTCPLPVDWLDLLEGRPSLAARPHLEVCASCRAVVDSLEATTAGEPVLDTPRDIPLVAVADRATPLAAGQIRWVAPPGADVRVPVLVIDVDLDDKTTGAHSGEQTDADTVHIVPVWTDKESATSSDLLLDPADTTVGIPWRVALRRQTMLPAGELGGELAELTAAGREKVDRALHGDIAPEASGPELESEFDPRLSADQWISDVVEQAQRRMSTDAAAIQAPNVLAFELKRITAASKQQQYALAAADPTAWAETLRASLVTPEGVSVTGDIRWLWPSDKTDRLVLRLLAVAGVDQPVVLIVYAHEREPLKISARLDVGSDVVLAEDLAISDRDIVGLEMRLS